MAERKRRAVIIAGGGGTGSAFFQDACRFLPDDIDIHLIDGDTVEGKNVQRQMFSLKHLGRNKAQCLAETASIALGQNRIYYHSYFIEDPAQLERIARKYKHVILVGCVDNHPARRRMEQFARNSTRPVYYIDCANGETNGQVVATNVRGGRVTGQFRSEWDPAVLTDTSGDPTTASCAEQLDAGNVQVLYTNRTSAILALKLTAYYLKGHVLTGIVYFSDVHIERLKGGAPGGSQEVAGA